MDLGKSSMKIFYCHGCLEKTYITRSSDFSKPHTCPVNYKMHLGYDIVATFRYTQMGFVRTTHYSRKTEKMH
jgi:hypothetical protein